MTRTNEEIEHFVSLFENTNLEPSEWTHSKHLVIALVYLVRYPRFEATERIRFGIKRLNHRFGNTTGYHETITLAWISVVSRFFSQSPENESLSILSRELLKQCGSKEYLLRYYSKDVLMSSEARCCWVPPDLTAIE